MTQINTRERHANEEQIDKNWLLDQNRFWYKEQKVKKKKKKQANKPTNQNNDKIEGCKKNTELGRIALFKRRRQHLDTQTIKNFRV